MGKDPLPVNLLEYGHVRMKDAKAPSGIRIPEPEAVRSDFVSKLHDLSPGRQKLMEKYFILDEPRDECPFLAEYFAVALAFTALGSLLRETNGLESRGHLKNYSQKADQQMPPKLRRMALETMLKEAMDRLKVLAKERRILEDGLKVKNTMVATFEKEKAELLDRATTAESMVTVKLEKEVDWESEKEELLKRVAEADAQRGYFFKHMNASEVQLAELQKLRGEDGKANARLVGIYASREQTWKLEKVKLTQEIETLKERNRKLNVQIRSLVLQCEKLEVSPEAEKNRNSKRMKESPLEKVHPVKGVRDANNVSLVEPEQPLIQPGMTLNVEKQATHVSEDQQQTPATTLEPLPQQQEMEAELASILKRVGQLKRRGTIGKVVTTALNSTVDLVNENSKAENDSKAEVSSSAEIGDSVQDDTIQETQQEGLLSLTNVDIKPLKFDVTTEPLDTSSKSLLLGDPLINSPSVIMDSLGHEDETKSNSKLQGEDRSSIRESSLERLEQELEANTDKFLAPKTSLEELEDELGEVVIVSGDESQASSKDEIFLDPSFPVGEKVEIVSPMSAVQIAPMLPDQKTSNRAFIQDGECFQDVENGDSMIAASMLPENDEPQELDATSHGVEHKIDGPERDGLELITALPVLQKEGGIPEPPILDVMPVIDEPDANNVPIVSEADHGVVEGVEEIWTPGEKVAVSEEVVTCSLEDDLVLGGDASASPSVSTEGSDKDVQPKADSNDIAKEECLMKPV